MRIECIEQCLPAAEKAGMMLALENHWGLTTRPENLLRICNAVRSPWLGINLDLDYQRIARILRAAFGG